MIDKNKKVLVYCGIAGGKRFSRLAKNHDVCFGFEANPHLIEKLGRFSSENTHIIHAALGTRNGFVNFNISNRLSSSSIGNKFCDGMDEFKFIEKVRVPLLNLYSYLKDKVEFITTYISDIQGMDLAVLKTLKPFIDNKAIGTIQCEVFLENKDIYPGLPSNFKDDYGEILRQNYELKSTHRGGYKLKSGVTPWWGDCVWKLKGP